MEISPRPTGKKKTSTEKKQRPTGRIKLPTVRKTNGTGAGKISRKTTKTGKMDKTTRRTGRAYAPPAKKTNTGVIIGASVGGFVLFMIILAAAISGGKDQPKKKAPPPPPPPVVQPKKRSLKVRTTGGIVYRCNNGAGHRSGEGIEDVIMSCPGCSAIKPFDPNFKCEKCGKVYEKEMIRCRECGGPPSGRVSIKVY